MGTHPIFESDFDCLTAGKWRVQGQDRRSGDRIEKSAIAKKTANVKRKSGNGTRKKPENQMAEIQKFRRRRLCLAHCLAASHRRRKTTTKSQVLTEKRQHLTRKNQLPMSKHQMLTSLSLM